MSTFSAPKIGSRLSVKVRYVNTNLFTKDADEFIYETYRGVVVSGEKFDKPNTFCLATENSIIPVRCIPLSSVAAMNVYGMSAIPKGVRAFKVASVKSGKSYIVTFNAGKTKCNCTGFSYRKKCRHTAAVMEKIKHAK